MGGGGVALSKLRAGFDSAHAGTSSASDPSARVIGCQGFFATKAQGKFLACREASGGSPRPVGRGLCLLDARLQGVTWTDVAALGRGGGARAFRRDGVCADKG